MSLINRSVMHVMPKAPFLEWVTRVDPTFDGALHPPTAYLVPEYDDDDEAAKVLDQVWPAMFDSELANWAEDETQWPVERSLAMFIEWFDVDGSPLVEDLCGWEILADGEHTCGEEE